MDDQAPTSPLGAGQRAPLSLSTGDLLAGRYRIAGFVARGGMGEVYEAEDLELGERCALKTLRSECLGDDDSTPG